MGGDGGRAGAARIIGPHLAEMVRSPVRPVQLIQIDHIGLQPPQRPLHSAAQRGGGDRGAIPHRALACAGHLCGQNHPVARPAFGNPSADDLFGAADIFGKNRVRRIHLGSVPEGQPVFQRQIDLVMRPRLGCLGAPGHRAQAEFGYAKAGPAKRQLFHAVSLVFRRQSVADGAGLASHKRCGAVENEGGTS